MPVPTYLAATAKYPGRPGQINQFLVGHSASYLYGGTLKSSQATGAATYVSTNGLYLAQQIVTASAQTTIGQLWLQVSTVGGSAVTSNITPLTVGLYANSGNLPTGSPLATASLNEIFVYGSGFWLQVPLAASGLSSSTPYQVVLAAAGNSSSYYVWQKSNQTSGASTSPDGLTWTAQTYGFMFEVYDLTGSGNPQYIVSDNGARWVQFTYDSLGRYSAVTENTLAQDGSSLYSSRTFAYTNGFLTGVS